MKITKIVLNTITALYRRSHKNLEDGKSDPCQGVLSPYRKSERGIALVVVLVLAGISLALITALIYMITMGTQTSGFQKRYRSALEAGNAGFDVVANIIEQEMLVKGDITSFLTGSLGSLGVSLNPSLAACTGTAYSSGTGVALSGSAAKIMSSSTYWNASCGDTSLTTDATKYDFKFTLGTSPQFNVYAKIVDVVEGNTGPGGNVLGHTLVLNPVVSHGTEIQSASNPYLYTIEIDSENTNTTTASERVKLSVLYQY